MTLAQMRLFLREGEKIKRRDRAAFMVDLHAAVLGVLGDKKSLEKRVDDFLE